MSQTGVITCPIDKINTIFPSFFYYLFFYDTCCSMHLAFTTEIQHASELIEGRISDRGADSMIYALAKFLKEMMDFNYWGVRKENATYINHSLTYDPTLYHSSDTIVNFYVPSSSSTLVYILSIP